jgi:RNA recognition motif-containing protein
MGKKLYVGNLPFTATEDEVKDLFAAHGEVTSVALVMDRESGRPRGFGFVEMDDSEADAAIAALDGTDFGGRTLRVNEAKERERRPRM